MDCNHDLRPLPVRPLPPIPNRIGLPDSTTHHKSSNSTGKRTTLVLHQAHGNHPRLRSRSHSRTRNPSLASQDSLSRPMPQGSRAAPPPKRRTISDAAKQPPSSLVHQSNHSRSHSHRGHGVVQLPRSMVSRAAAIPPPVNPNHYSYVGMSKGVLYVKDKDKDKPGIPSTPSSPNPTLTSPICPVAQPFSPVLHINSAPPITKLLDEESLHSHPISTELDGAASSPKDDDAISYLSYIDPPETTTNTEPSSATPSPTVFPISSPPSTSASASVSASTSTSTAPAPDTDESPLIVYVDDNFDSSPEGEEFARSVSPMRYARPGSDGTVGSSGESAEESDFFSDVDDPFKYNKRRSRRRGRTRTRAPLAVSAGGDATQGGGVGTSASAPGDVRSSESLGSLNWRNDHTPMEEKKEAARPKSVERYLPHQHYQPQRFHSVTALTGLVVPDRKPEEEPLSPLSVASLSPMRYAKRNSVELLDDDSPITPVSPRKGKGRSKTKKRRGQPWSYQFDYQAAKASSPFTFGMGEEKAKGKEREKEKEKEREKEKEKEKEKEREKAAKNKSKKDGRLSEPVKRRLSIDVLDISLLRSRTQAAAATRGNDKERRSRFWDDSTPIATIDIAPSSHTSTQSTPTLPPLSMPMAMQSHSNTVVETPIAVSPPPSVSTSSGAGVAPAPPTRTRTFKVHNP